MLHGRDRPSARPGRLRHGASSRCRSTRRRSSTSRASQVVRKGDFIGVVAPQEYVAIQAAAQLKVKWPTTPSLSGQRQPVQRDARGDRRPTADRVVDTGDIDGRFREGGEDRRGDLHVAVPVHGSIGPRAAVADVKPDGGDRLAETQNPYGPARQDRDMLGMTRTSDPRAVLRGLELLGNCAVRRRGPGGGVMSQARRQAGAVQFMRWDEHGWDNYGPAQLDGHPGGRRRERQDRRVRLHVVWSRTDVDRDARRARRRDATPRRLRQLRDRRTGGGEYAIAEPPRLGKSHPLNGGYHKIAALRAPRRAAGAVRVGADDRRARVRGEDGPARVPPAEHHARQAVARRARRGREGVELEAAASRRRTCRTRTSSPVAASRSARTSHAGPRSSPTSR